MSRRWHKVWVGVRVLGVLVALAAAGCWVGWRYGFKELPEAVPGVVFQPQLPGSRAALGPSNCWYWCQALDLGLRGRSNQMFLQTGYFPTLETWVRSPVQASANTEGLARWLGENATIAACLEEFLRAPETEPPASFAVSDLRAYQVLFGLPRIRAAFSEKEGRTAAALMHLVDAWRVQARVTPPAAFPGFFDERGAEELHVLLVRPWRRLVMEGNPLSEEEVRGLFQALATVTNQLASVEAAFVRVASQALTQSGTRRAPDWQRVRNTFRIAWLRTWQDMGRLLVGVLEKALGRRSSGINVQGVRYFGRPLATLWETMQRVAAQSADHQRMEEAWVTAALAWLRSGEGTPASPGAASDERAGAGPTGEAGWVAGMAPQGWGRYFDRPAVWRAASALPRPELLLESQAAWRLSFESCRLTLALRVFRDRHHRWPERWEEMVPAILDSVPVDPFAGRPLGYARKGEGWEFWVADAEGNRPPLATRDHPPQRLFSSAE